ncbi:MAG: arylamine N-acetyltransferase [Amphritea sp.]
MTLADIKQAYLADLDITQERVNLELIKQIQSRHIARYCFNSLAVVLSQEIPIDSESVFQKIVEQGRGGYCFEHNKLVFDVLTELALDVRILLARVVYNKEVEAPRTHRITLLKLDGEDYIVDTGFGHYGARYPVKLKLGLDQDQGDVCYRIIQNKQGDYCYQIFKDNEFFTLYTFDLNTYTEADCMTGHFYSHKFPQAGFVNNLVVSRKHFNNIQSLRNNEFHQTENGETQITPIKDVADLHDKLTRVFELDVDGAISEFLFNKFAK